MPKKKSALFLDRDGVLNVRKFEGYIQSVEEFAFLPRVVEALQSLQPRFDYIFVVTNQQGVAKGWMQEDEVQEIHLHMRRELANHNIRIHGIYTSYDSAQKLPNTRKPNPHLALRAQREFPDFQFQDAVMVGDTLSDMQFGRNLGMHCAWIRSAPPFEEQVPHELYDWQGNSLFQLAQEAPSFLPAL